MLDELICSGTYSVENFPDERVEANGNSIESSVEASASQPLTVSVGVGVETTCAHLHRSEALHSLDVTLQVVHVRAAG